MPAVGLVSQTLPVAGDTSTILVAEDEEGVRSMTALVLRSSGDRTIVRADGREAVEQLEAGVYVDAVLMDIPMPRLR